MRRRWRSKVIPASTPDNDAVLRDARTNEVVLITEEDSIATGMLVRITDAKETLDHRYVQMLGGARQFWLPESFRIRRLS
jgi:hypothetical protein